ncbi:MAG: GW dipeptide domain-containing protein [Saprospiraceae bacterium]
MFIKYYGFVLSIMILFWSCDSKPKMIVEDSAPAVEENGINNTTLNQNSVGATNSGNVDVHQVVVNEILQTERYSYLLVEEKGRKFWLATAKIEAEKGKTYLYRGGLLKTNFESREYNRTFDTLYLVSNIIPADEHPGGQIGSTSSQVVSPSSSGVSSDISAVKDAVKLSDLFANKAKYDGKIITIVGECVKVNNGIMGKNWVHIQDGSKQGDKKADLTVTTGMVIPLGSKVALKGKIVLNKDFGAGYRYDVIMEEASGM